MNEEEARLVMSLIDRLVDATHNTNSRLSFIEKEMSELAKLMNKHIK